MSEFRSRTSLTLVLASALALAACGKSEPPPAPAPAAPAPAPAPATPPPEASAAAPAATPAAAVQITSITFTNALGADGKVTTPLTTFGPKDTIYGVVAATAAQASTAITAHWNYQGGQLVSEQVQTLNMGPSVSEFHISKPDGFPAGNYSLEILVNGNSVSSATFTVK